MNNMHGIPLEEVTACVLVHSLAQARIFIASRILFLVRSDSVAGTHISENISHQTPVHVAMVTPVWVFQSSFWARCLSAAFSHYFKVYQHTLCTDTSQSRCTSDGTQRCVLFSPAPTTGFHLPDDQRLKERLSKHIEVTIQKSRYPPQSK